MDDEPKTNEEFWAVEPPKKASSRKRKALRIALIAAAIGAAAAAGACLYGSYLKRQLRDQWPLGGDINIVVSPDRPTGEEEGTTIKWGGGE